MRAILKSPSHEAVSPQKSRLAVWWWKNRFAPSLSSAGAVQRHNDLRAHLTVARDDSDNPFLLKEKKNYTNELLFHVASDN